VTSATGSTPSEVHGLVATVRGRATGDPNASHCLVCGHVSFYLRPFCSSCGGSDVEVRSIHMTGVVGAVTVVRRSRHPVWGDRTPYAIAHVRLPEGATFVAVADASTEGAAVNVGDEVTAVLRDDDQTGIPRWTIEATS
jgi:uncharacterized OB-fold protein